MQIDDPVERTPDLVSKIRKLHELAEKEMNKFTSVSDYDVRRVVGQKSQAEPVQEEIPPAASDGGRAKKKTGKLSSTQTAIEFSPAPTEPGDDWEGE